MRYSRTELIYSNKLSCQEDVKDFKMEGFGAVTFPMKRMRLESVLDPSELQRSNIVFWCDKDFPDNIEISWDFYPLSDVGLAIMFFAAKGRNGESIFSPSLSKREGMYPQYHSSDINALHVSYFRRRAQRSYNVCNLRKSHGFNLVAQGADPIPSVNLAQGPYRIKIVKYGSIVEFYIANDENNLKLFSWKDDGESYGNILKDGKIGFRQMAPLIAEYENLQIHKIKAE
ncbi:DUF1961 family protein [Vallitalea okinawensis]|uniref:DUF1961 family protein n=1 Tax=Vallitalea okinawensis TaxID=2078660 RepID=UPI000CFD63A6|nr:DUF1961 family protein [Vallitalea okinawensis]